MAETFDIPKDQLNIAAFVDHEHLRINQTRSSVVHSLNDTLTVDNV